MLVTIFSREVIRKFVEPYENYTILGCSLNLSLLMGQMYNGNHSFHIDNVNQRIDNPRQSSRVSCETVTAAKTNKSKLEQSLFYSPPEQSAIGNCRVFRGRQQAGFSLQKIQLGFWITSYCSLADYYQQYGKAQPSLRIGHVYLLGCVYREHAKLCNFFSFSVRIACAIVDTSILPEGSSSI